MEESKLVKEILIQKELFRVLLYKMMWNENKVQII